MLSNMSSDSGMKPNRKTSERYTIKTIDQNGVEFSQSDSQNRNLNSYHAHVSLDNNAHISLENNVLAYSPKVGEKKKSLKMDNIPEKEDYKMFSHAYNFDPSDNYTVFENKGSVYNAGVNKVINNLFSSGGFSEKCSVSSINVDNNEEIKSNARSAVINKVDDGS